MTEAVMKRSLDTCVSVLVVGGLWHSCSRGFNEQGGSGVAMTCASKAAKVQQREISMVVKIDKHLTDEGC